MYKKVSVALIALAMTGCTNTPKGPHTGTDVTQTFDSSGLSTTSASTRSVMPTGGLKGEDSELREISAKVNSVNQKTRILALQTPDGNVVSVKAGPEVRNLPQIKVGDNVNLSYFESVAFEVRKPTAEELALSGSGVALAGRAPKGGMPGAVAATGHVGVLTIESIDTKKELITLKGNGGLVTVKAKYPENLKLIKTGDTVVVTTSELLAASVERAG